MRLFMLSGFHCKHFCDQKIFDETIVALSLSFFLSLVRLSLNGIEDVVSALDRRDQRMNGKEYLHKTRERERERESVEDQQSVRDCKGERDRGILNERVREGD